MSPDLLIIFMVNEWGRRGCTLGPILQIRRLRSSRVKLLARSNQWALAT